MGHAKKTNYMDIDKINKELKSVQTLINNRPKEEFDGLSPIEMYYLLHKTFEKESPFQFRDNIDNHVFEQMPILKFTQLYLGQVKELEPINLTAKGNLPLKLIKTIYEQKTLPEKYIEHKNYKFTKEQDSAIIHTVRLISELLQLTRKTKNKLTLTKKGNQMLTNEDQSFLFIELFKCYTTQFNWAYHDFYGDHPIGQLGFAFMIEQLIKYGDKELPATFYGKKYLNAFPMLLQYTGRIPHRSKEEELINCFASRMFYDAVLWGREFFIFKLYYMV